MTKMLVTGWLAYPRQIQRGRSYVAGHTSKSAQSSSTVYMGRMQNCGLFLLGHLPLKIPILFTASDFLHPFSYGSWPFVFVSYILLQFEMSRWD
jgi:hypothetical protein